MNHLLIGLGGTGVRVIRSFRKSMYLAYRDQSPDGIVLDYMLVDSDPSSFLDSDPSWTVLGQSVQLPKKNRLLIAQANLISVINNLQAYDDLRPWIGDRGNWGEILHSLNVEAAGGQKRRLGRFLFAMSVHKFRDAVSDLVRDMQRRGPRTTDCTFHVFCGLAGGTGSGSVVDVAAQIRRMYPNPAQHKIILYCYLPDLNPPAGWDKPNYFPNAYAALLELNALSTGAWTPFDISGKHGQAPTAYEFAFNGCYLFSDKNAQGYAAAIDRDLLDVVANFVFHKTVLAHNTNWEQLSKAENAENGDSSPEKPTSSKAGFRSVRFLSFGISRIAFPEETIREALTFEFERQALNQLAFNNWQDGVGYLERAKQRADADFVASPQQRQEWRLTDEHLRLQRPIIDSDATRKWHDFHEEWESWETHYVSISQMTDTPRWLNELKTLFQSAWTSGFRSGGAPQFFEAAQRDRRALASAIRDRVEASLFDDWRNGVRAMCDCARVIAALIDDVEARNAKMADYVQKRDDGAADLDRQFAEIERKWSRLRLIPGARAREITKAGLLLREQHCEQTLALGGRFARALCDELVTQLSALKREVDQAEMNLTDAARKASVQIKARSAALVNQPGSDEGISYVGDTSQLELARRKLVLNEDEQRTHTAAVRLRIIGKLEGQPTFAKLADGLGGGDIANAILSTSSENMASAHQRLLTDRKERVIGVSVIDKLIEQWGDSQERLDKEAAHLARSAGRFLVFDETEQRKGFPGKTDHERALQSIGVLLPPAADHREFLAKLTTAFENAHLGGSVQEIRSPRQDQIALVTITNLFPLRFVGLVKELKARYEQRIARGGRARAALEIHIEGDGTQFSDLFIPGGGDIAKLSRAPLLIAAAAGGIEREPAGPGGRGSMILRRKDEHGFEIEPIRLGADLAEAAGQLTEAQLYTLQEMVEPLAKSLRGRTDDALAAVRQRMLAEIEILRASRNVGPTDPEILAWNQAGSEAMRTIQDAV